MKYTLKALRVNTDLSQENAAKKLGVSTSTLASWESYKTFPNARDISKLTELYSTTYDDIIFLPIKTVKP